MNEFENKPEEMMDEIIDNPIGDWIEPGGEEEAHSLVPRPSFRKSGVGEPMAMQVQVNTLPHYPDPTLYQETKEDAEKRRKENRSFYRFIASVLIFAMVGAPFLGVGIGLGVRFFDSYFLPILMDDTIERENFSFDNIMAPPIVPTQNHIGTVDRPNYVELVQLVEPSVVLISATMPGGARNNFFNFGGPNQAGSGIMMYETSTRYYIATNAHVIAGADSVSVSIAGSEKIPALPVGRDDDADLAVIAVNKADAIAAGITSVRLATFGDSSLMRVGEGVVAIGNSMGEGNTVTNGIVSAIDREIFVSDRHLPEVIQTNAAINQGNSGGPLVNLDGHVIGINTAKFSERLAEGMGYAIPSNVAMPILERIMHQQEVAADSGQRPMIGIGFVEITQGMAEAMREQFIMQGADEDDLIVPSQGLLITRIFPNSPADRAGLAHHDVIRAVNGQMMTAEHEIIDIFSQLEVGDTVTLHIIRDGVDYIVIEIPLGPHISTF